MSYLVLARKWRPQRFDEVVGQGSVTQTLKRALMSDRVSHSFLFTGSRGIGKTTLARIMAKALCCPNTVDAEPCNTCQSCTDISSGHCLDVVEIDGASNTGIDQIRELRENARYAPTSCPYKIYIIDEVHMLSTSAFNGLLKTLEEPPPHVKFIFATTEAHKIPVTVLSRCQRYDFKRIHTSAIIERLNEVLAKEETSISPAGLSLIAHAANGGMRDALSLTDQVLSFAPEGASGEDVAQALGLIDQRAILKTTEALIDRDSATAIAMVKNAYQNGHDLKQLVTGIAEYLRHLAISASVGTIEGQADLSPDAIVEVDTLAQKVKSRDAQRMLSAMLEGIDRVSRSEQSRLEAELIMLQLCDRPPVQNAMHIAHALVRLGAFAKGREVPPLPEGTFTALAKESLAHKGSGPMNPSAPTAKAAPPAAKEAAPAAPAAPTPNEAAPTPATKEVPPKNASTQQAAASPASKQTSTSQTQKPPERQAPPTPRAQKNSPPPPSERPPIEDTNDEEEEGGTFHFDPALGYDLDGVDERWLTFVREVAFKNSSVAGWLGLGHFVTLDQSTDPKVVRVAFKLEIQIEVSERRKKHPAVLMALQKVFGENVELEIIAHSDEVEANPSIAEAQKHAQQMAIKALEAHAREHPIVQKAITLFGGEVREVRSAHS